MAIEAVGTASRAFIQASTPQGAAEGSRTDIPLGSPINQLQTSATLSEFGRALSAESSIQNSGSSPAPANPANNTPSNESVTVSSTVGASATRGGMSADEAMAVYRAVAGML